jgi:N-acetylmuramoyl-L-alanine amidase
MVRILSPMYARVVEETLSTLDGIGGKMIRRLAVCVGLAMTCAALARIETTRVEPTSKPARPTIVTRAEWKSTPMPIDESRRQTPKRITLHHAGVLWKVDDDPVAKIKNLQTWGQKEKGWPDVPYHFLIAPDGRIFEGRDWNYEPESNTKYALNGILNIQLWGDFEQQRVSPAQLRATVELVAWACGEFDVDPATVWGHKDAAPGQTTCPGRDFHRYIERGMIADAVRAKMSGAPGEVELLQPMAEGPTTQIATSQPGQTTTK